VFLEVIVALVPNEPVINWNTLPASVNWTEVTYLLLSVKVTEPEEPDNVNDKEPKNKASLYLTLSKV